MKNKKNVWDIAHFNVNAYLCPENNEVFSVFLRELLWNKDLNNES